MSGGHSGQDYLKRMRECQAGLRFYYEVGMSPNDPRYIEALEEYHTAVKNASGCFDDDTVADETWTFSREFPT